MKSRQGSFYGSLFLGIYALSLTIRLLSHDEGVWWSISYAIVVSALLTIFAFVNEKKIIRYINERNKEKMPD